MPITDPTIENNFTYHPPKDEATKEKYEKLRAEFKRLAYIIKEQVPNSREQSTAITMLETSSFWANAGIARNG